MKMVKRLIWGGAIFGVIAIILLQYIKEARTSVTSSYLNKTFSHTPVMGAYVEALPKVFGGSAKATHGVLLLHGYSASPQEFDHLVKGLKHAGIPYYAPLLTGFGVDDFRLLEVVKPEDWKRDALMAYEVVAAMAEKVSIVGHSNGGALATIVAAHRPVEKLILSGPGIFAHPDDAFLKSVVTAPVMSDVAPALIPVFEKPRRPNRVTNTDTKDPEAAKRSFHFPTMASPSLVTVWTLQDQVDISQASFHELWLLYGADDQTVDIPGTIATLKRMNISFREKSFPRSGHNILEDYDKDAVVQFVIDILIK
jgi:carboxylesterase